MVSKIIFNEEEHSCEELSSVLLQFKSYLLTICKNGGPVVIAIERCPNFLLIMQAAYECNITFVPIELSYPLERIRYIISQVKPELIINNEHLNFEYHNATVVSVDDIMSSNKEIYFYKLQNEIAYILFTSGSTGKPKGIQVLRSGLDNFFSAMKNILDLRYVKRIASFTTVGFDIFILESLFAFYLGLDIVLANNNEQINPYEMAKLIENSLVDLIQFTPSRMRLLMSTDLGKKSLRTVKVVLLGGEVLPDKMLQELKKCTNAKIYNMYGPTETTIWSSVADLTETENVNIGYPIDNTEFYIIDNENNTDNNEIGELCISGAGLAKGYINNIEQTQKSFIFLSSINKFVYKTGDLVKKSQDGYYLCLGRIDNQIKWHGYRIEPEELENIILCNLGITSIVKVQDDQLVCYYVKSNSSHNYERDLKEILSKNAPEYMIPSKWIQVNHIPLNLNGKIDRTVSLNNFIIYDQVTDNKKSYENNLFGKFASIVEKTLDINFVNVEICKSQILKECGIDSIKYVSLIIELEIAFEIEFAENKMIMSEFNSFYDLYEYIVSLVNV